MCGSRTSEEKVGHKMVQKTNRDRVGCSGEMRKERRNMVGTLWDPWLVLQ